MSDLSTTLAQVLTDLKTNNTVTIKGFGTFTLKTVAARTRRNPRTGASVQAPEFKKVTFKMSKSFRDELAK